MKKFLLMMVIVSLSLGLIACQKDGVEVAKDGQASLEEVKIVEDFFTVYNENLSKSQEEVDKLLSEGDYIGLDSTEKKEGTKDLTEAWLEEYRPYVKEESLEKMAANYQLAPLIDEKGDLKEISIGKVKKLEDNKYEVELTTNLQKETKKVSLDLEEVEGQKKILYLDMDGLLK